MTPPLTDERLAEYVTLGPPTRQVGAEIARELAELLRQLREAGEALDDGADLLANEAATERERSGRYPVETSYFKKYDSRARLAAKQSDQLRALRGLVRTPHGKTLGETYPCRECGEAYCDCAVREQP
jgi:hypothetical protein